MGQKAWKLFLPFLFFKKHYFFGEKDKNRMQQGENKGKRHEKKQKVGHNAKVLEKIKNSCVEN